MNDRTSQRRLNTLFGHLRQPHLHHDEAENKDGRVTLNPTLSFGSITETQRQSFNVDAMSEWLTCSVDTKLRNTILEVARSDLLRKQTRNLPKEDQRRITNDQVKYVAGHEVFHVSQIKEDPTKFMQVLECFCLFPASTSVKFGVQYLLFTGSIINLGTERHKHLISRAERLELPGCFGMTELAHGSAVQKLETTAVYDETTKEFVINTPSKGALKWWLGNAATAALMCSVFVRLIVKDVDYGIHVILVPIRDEKTKKPLPGVIIGDCGDKMGLDGVDNGFLGFKNVRVPRENLLNRFGDVDEDGNYASSFDSNTRRFAAHMGELITGRVSIVFTSLHIRRSALTIATRYAARRKQFGAPGQSGEQSILSYRSHQMKLLPMIASCYIYEFSKRILVNKYVNLHTVEKVSDDELAELHALSAGMKAVFSWDTQDFLEVCREACGGHGYSAYNRFGDMINDHSIFKTFEGDNTVLIQQLGGYLMREFAKQFQKNQVGAVINLIGSKIGAAISTINPAQVFTNPNLLSSRFQIQAFQHRTASILQACAQEINSKRKKKGFFDAWNDSLPQVTALSRCYVEQYALEEFNRNLRSLKDRELRAVLKKLRNIWVLDIMRRDFIHFVNIINVRPESIRKTMESQCSKVADHAVSLVDAFNIPDFLLDAPIGLAKGNYMDHVLRYALERNPGNHEALDGIEEFLDGIETSRKESEKKFEKTHVDDSE